MKIALILTSLFVASFAQARIVNKSVTYTGNLNGETVSLTLTVADESPVEAKYIGCQDQNENACNDPGQYAFFARPGQATFKIGNETGVAPLVLALYTGQDAAPLGTLSGTYNFVDRTATANKVNGVTFYEDGFLGNKLQASVSGLTLTDIVFPATYTVRWDNHDDEYNRGSDSGTLTLTLQ